MKTSGFHHEVEYRVSMLEADVAQMAVGIWCSDVENLNRLRQLCSDTEIFMMPESNATRTDTEVRAGQWRQLYAHSPEVLEEVLLLSGCGRVLKKHAMKGERYAGAVLHCLLKRWCARYGHGGVASRRESSGNHSQVA